MATQKKAIVRSQGAHGLRLELRRAQYHLEILTEAIEAAMERSGETGATEQLAFAVRALRSIANFTGADGRSRGLARGALKRMGIKP